MKFSPPSFFDWDEGNINKNWEKHKVHFKECEEVFFNKPLKVFSNLMHSSSEKRFLAFGSTNSNRRLTIIFTIRRNGIRIISARDQNKKERANYGKK